MAVKSFLGADTIDEWRPKSLALCWGGGSDVGSDDSGGTYASGDTSGGWGGDFGGGFGGGWSDSWGGGGGVSYTDGSNAFGQDYSGGGDSFGGWQGSVSADAFGGPGAGYQSGDFSTPGWGAGDYGAWSGMPSDSFSGMAPGGGYNFGAQSFDEGGFTTPGVVNFSESGNYWGANPVADLGNYLTGGYIGGPSGWQGEFGAYGNMAGPSMGYANYAGNVTAPGLVGGFMDAGPFGTNV